MTYKNKCNMGIVFALPIMVILIQHYLPWDVLISYLVAINIITAILYAYDKSISGSTARRMPEQSLHLLAVLGGSPAALIAQKVFCHKTAKPSFLIIYWIIVLLQTCLFCYLIYKDILF